MIGGAGDQGPGGWGVGEGRTRVLWLAEGLGAGGVERLLIAGARHVDRSRFDVEVAYVRQGRDALAFELEEAGAPVHHLPARTWPLRLRALVERRRYQLVHTHAPGPAVAARLLLRGRLSVPLVHTQHRPWDRQRLPVRLADALTYRRNEAVTAVCAAVAHGVRPGGVPVSVVRHFPAPPGDPLPAARAREALGVPRNAVVIGAVGGLTARKDHRTLLDAYALMRRNHPGTALVLVGAGPLEAPLRRHAQELGVHDAVVFAGERPDIPVLLPAFDVFALPSREEGLPVALMEAMAAGLPSVATRVGGVPELMTEGAEGLLVRPGDAEALSVALGRLVSGPGLRARMAASARERSRHFDAAAAQRAIEEVYTRALTTHAARRRRPETAPPPAAPAELPERTEPTDQAEPADQRERPDPA